MFMFSDTYGNIDDNCTHMLELKSITFDVGATINCIHYILPRFKDHVQNNNPKHFLSEVEFVQLRLEFAAASKPSGEGEEETPSEELPPGTEDLPDPAKVRAQDGLLVGIKHARDREDPTWSWREAKLYRFEEVSFR